MLKIGDTAPDFKLPTQHWGQTVKLSDFRGKQNVVIAFHPLAFTPVCSTQMTNYQNAKAEFDRLNAHILSISCDPGPSKRLGPIRWVSRWIC
jgi:peroxiredoxin